MSTLSPEKAPSALRSVETQKLIVRQPTKLAELNNLLSTFENLNARVSERVGEDISGDMGGSGSGATGGQQGDDDVSPREIAIRNMPSNPQVVRQKLEGHIKEEVSKLEKLAKAHARSGAPGSAFKLNEVYGRIRRLNAMLHEILEASYDVLKRLFIRVFIDQQTIL